MKLKAIVICVLLAFSVNAVASSSDGNTARRQRSSSNPKKPQVPQRPKPKFPNLPGTPGLPNDPTLPPLPTIPPPGKHNPKGGPEVPFPMSITLPFPWGAIEGMWKVSGEGADTLFSFSVQMDVDGIQYLRVLQIDAESGSILAEGVGIGVENDKLVRAAMTSKTTKANYMLFIGSYKNTGAHAAVILKSVTVLTVRPFSSLMGDNDVQMVVEKVSNVPYIGPGQCPAN